MGYFPPPAFSWDQRVPFQLFCGFILLTDLLTALRSLHGSPKHIGGSSSAHPLTEINPLPLSTPSTDSQIQTFLSFSEPSVRRTPLACMCRYRTRCSADMSHLITYSTCQNPTGTHAQPLGTPDMGSFRSGKPPIPRGITTPPPAQPNPATTEESDETPPARSGMGKSSMETPQA